MKTVHLGLRFLIFDIFFFNNEKKETMNIFIIRNILIRGKNPTTNVCRNRILYDMLINVWKVVCFNHKYQAYSFCLALTVFTIQTVGTRRAIVPLTTSLRTRHCTYNRAQVYAISLKFKNSNILKTWWFFFPLRTHRPTGVVVPWSGIRVYCPCR